MSMSTSSGTLGPAAVHLGGTERPARLRTLAAAAATLSAWRNRAHERAELAAMERRERRDLPYARDFDITREIPKPFWCAYFIYGTGRRSEG